MKRIYSFSWLRAAVCLPILLTGCAAPIDVVSADAPLFPMTSNETDPPSATTWISNRCGYSVRFSAPPQKVDLQAGANESFAEVMSNGDLNFNETASCHCWSNNLNPKIESVGQFEGNIRPGLKKFDANLTAISRFSGGKLYNDDNIIEYIADGRGQQGSYIARNRYFSNEICRFGVTRISLSTDLDSKNAYRFLASAQNLKASTPAINSPARASGDATERLRTLKNLFDQKLITPTEYEAKRRTILDSM